MKWSFVGFGRSVDRRASYKTVTFHPVHGARSSFSRPVWTLGMECLEEDLTCSVCYSLFSDPRVLPCSHTFCKTCLDSVLQVSSNYSLWRPLRMPLKCPNCRDVAELPPTGTDALPCNVSLKAIIEKYQRDGHPRGPLCKEHQQQPLNMYCVLDRQLICGLCLTIGQHQGHPIDDLQAAYVREKQTPQLLAKLSEQKWTQVCELAKQLEQEKEDCDRELQQDRKQVLQFFRYLDASLVKKKQAYLDALDKACAEVAHAYDPLIYRVKELQEEQLDLVSLGSDMEDEDSALIFLDKVHLFRGRVEEFVEKPLPSALSLSVGPRAADYLNTHWPAVTLRSLDQAPVPKVTCCTRCSQAARSHPSSRLLRLCPGPLLVCALLVGLLLMAVGVYPEGGSFGFSLLPSIGEVVNSVSSEVVASGWSAAELLVTYVHKCRLVTMGKQTFQKLSPFLKSLTDWHE
ncbi:tripartite motif-containing protein 59 [Eucyclogobius newberryi]|uniref:tripartite motif-containing protein 59 n=1 Tax=Eucyclogobius newberryi TaxID=166745 RepID=UPI003B5A1207